MNYKIKLDNIKKIEIKNIKGGSISYQIMRKYKPDFLINLALYDTTTGINITKMKVDGEDSGYLFSDYGLCFDDKIEFNEINDEIQNFVSGSPVLIKDSQEFIDWGNKYSSYIDGEHKRSCVGFNQDELILYNSDEALNLEDTVKECLELGMEFGINLDGGGSCHLQDSYDVLNKSFRNNVSWLLVYLKDEEVLEHEVEYGVNVHSFSTKESATDFSNELKEKYNAYSQVYEIKK
ncbi:MAG: phosphodiester glycosidase family protein [Peptostreptococcaceae bacterium]